MFTPPPFPANYPPGRVGGKVQGVIRLHRVPFGNKHRERIRADQLFICRDVDILVGNHILNGAVLLHNGILHQHTVAVLIAYIILYAKLGLLNISEIFKVRGIVIHNVVNIAVLILIKAISYTFKAESILYSESGAVYGAGYTDITVWMNYYRIIPFLLLTIVLLTMIFLYRGKYKWSIGTILVYPVTYLAFFVFSLGLQTFYVKPEEVNREAPYIANTSTSRNPAIV